MMNNFLSDFIILPTRIKRSPTNLTGYGSSLGKFNLLEQKNSKLSFKLKVYFVHV